MSNAVTVTEIEINNGTTTTTASAEPEFCGDHKGGCEHICDDADGTIHCLCYRGYVLDEDQKSCTGKGQSVKRFDSLRVSCTRDTNAQRILKRKIDVDECLVDNGGCEGVCVNKQGSYQCFCSAGFRLASNGKKCIGKTIMRPIPS